MSLALAQWIQAAEAAVRELGMTMLNQDMLLHGRQSEIPDGTQGALIALGEKENEVQLGLLSDAAGTQKLARAFLGAEETDVLSPEAVMDGMLEMVNILAGSVKALLVRQIADARMGLPYMAYTFLENQEKYSCQISHVSLGPLHFWVIAAEHKPQSASGNPSRQRRVL